MNVSKRTENPDLIIKGEINKFYGKSEMNNFGKISGRISVLSTILAPLTEEETFYYGGLPFLTWFLGVPISKNTVEIEITLKTYNNQLLGTYTGKGQKRIESNIYTNGVLAVLSMTNKVFSEIIKTLRNQILNDIDKYN